MRNIITLAVICFAASFMASDALAQQFAIPVESYARKKPGFITMTDGSELECFFRNQKIKKGLIKMLIVEDTKGTKHKIGVDDIKAYRVPASKLGELAVINEATSTMQKMGEVDFNTVLKRDFVYFEKATLPNKKSTKVLLQLVNPGFESKIRVYHDPMANETGTASIGGIAVAGGEAKSYYLIKDGKAIKVKKKDYKKNFKSIFGDCDFMKKEYKKLKFLDFAEHVFVHEQKCD